MAQQVPRLLREDVARREEYDQQSGPARSELVDRMAASKEAFGERGQTDGPGKTRVAPGVAPAIAAPLPETVEVRLERPAPAGTDAAPKMKFSSARARVLSDNEYEYAIDPSSGVIKFLKVPAGKEHLVGKYLTSANQKNAAAYKAIMDMYRTKYPPSTDTEEEIVEEVDFPASPAPKPMVSSRSGPRPGSTPDRRTFLSTDFSDY